MKFNFTQISLAMALAGSFAFTEAQAVTAPATVTEFQDSSPQTLTIHASGWSDPAFGDMGWTHRSGWGKFTANKGQKVDIMVDTGIISVHPGISVWYRDPVKDSVDDKYVFDHFYAQMANQFKSSATDESTGASLCPDFVGADGKLTKPCNLVLKNVAYGYDLDGKNNARITELRGIRDTIPGKLTLSFTAPSTGTYMFVVGGINPGADLFDLKTAADGTVTKTLKVDPATTNYTKIPVTTTVTVTTP